MSYMSVVGLSKYYLMDIQKMLQPVLSFGIQMWYFLKAQFHYTKNQYANLLLIIGITGSFSQVRVYLVTFSRNAFIYNHSCAHILLRCT